MKALVIDDTGHAPRLALRQLPQPEPGVGELLVRVRMAGINRADLALSKHHYAINPLGIAGSELAGEVVGMGDGCPGFAIGDRVIALASACHAERVCIDHRLAIHVPDSMCWQTAAALPAWYMTAHNALMTEGRLRVGESVLIQGATSGVGIATAQLAKRFGAAVVFGVARSADKLQAVAAQGVDVGLTADSAWADAVNDATGGRGVDLIIDMVGGGALGGNLRSVAVLGRIVAVGRLGGANDTLDIAALAYKRVHLMGVTFRSRSVEEKARIARAFATGVLPWVCDGRIRPLIDRVYPLAEAEAAQEHVRRNAHFGKVLLEVR